MPRKANPRRHVAPAGGGSWSGNGVRLTPYDATSSTTTPSRITTPSSATGAGSRAKLGWMSQFMGIQPKKTETDFASNTHTVYASSVIGVKRSFLKKRRPAVKYRGLAVTLCVALCVTLCVALACAGFCAGTSFLSGTAKVSRQSIVRSRQRRAGRRLVLLAQAGCAAGRTGGPHVAQPHRGPHGRVQPVVRRHAARWPRSNVALPGSRPRHRSRVGVRAAWTNKFRDR